MSKAFEIAAALLLMPVLVTFGGFVAFVFGLLMTYLRYENEVKRRAWPMLLLPVMYPLMWTTAHVFQYPGRYPQAGPISEEGQALVIALLVLTAMLSAVTIWLMRKAWPFALFYGLTISSYVLSAAFIAGMMIGGDGP